MAQHTKKVPTAPKIPLGDARQVRFEPELEKAIQEIADANGIEFVQAVRQVARVGAPIIKKRLAASLSEAA